MMARSRPRAHAASCSSCCTNRATSAEAVVQRHRRDAQDVRFAPVERPRHARRAARTVRRPASRPARTRNDSWQPRCAASRGVTHCSRAGVMRVQFLQQQCVHRQRLGAQRRHAGRCRTSRSEASSGAAERIGGLLTCQPAAPGDGMEFRPHAKARGRDRGPTSRPGAAAWLAAMALVHEGAAQRAGAAIQVLVAAPDREVGARIVQCQRQVADGMRQVEATGARRARAPRARCAPGRRPGRCGTARRATAPARPPRRAAASSCSSCASSSRSSARRRRDLDQRIGGIQAVPVQLAGHGMAVGREGAGLDDDAAAPCPAGR